MKKLASILLFLPLLSYGQGQFPVGGNSDTIRFGNIKVVNEAFYNAVPTLNADTKIPAWGNVRDSSNSIVLPTVDAMMAYKGFSNRIFVSDSNRGGWFVRVSFGVVDNGTVFDGFYGDYWARDFDESVGVNIDWFGADHTGVADNAAILNKVIFFTKHSDIYCYPNGVYRTTKTIGLPNDAMRLSGTNRYILSKRLSIHGNGAVIKMDATAEKPNVLVIENSGYDLYVQNLNIDGDTLTNRGIYIRNILGAGTANIVVDNCEARNMFISSAFIETSCSGIFIYGRCNIAKVVNCKVNYVTGKNNQAIRGITVSGQTGFFPKTVIIDQNFIDDVQIRDGLTTAEDVDAIFVGGVGAESGSAFISCNTVKNSGLKRGVKVQFLESLVEGNTFIYDTSFIRLPSAPALTATISGLYSNMTARDNTILYGGNAVHSHAFSIIERAASVRPSRMNVENTLVRGDTINSFFRVQLDTASSTVQTVVSAENNVLDMVATNMFLLTGGTTNSSNKSLSLNRNYANRLTNSFFKRDIKFQATVGACDNFVRDAVTLFSDSLNRVSGYNNYNITMPDTFATKADLRALSGTYEVTTNKATNFSTLNNTLYPSTQAVNDNFVSIVSNSTNKTTSTNTFTGSLNSISGNVSTSYNTTATNRPTSTGGVFIQGNYFSGVNDFKWALMAGWANDEVYYRSTNNGTVGNTYRVASREFVASTYQTILPETFTSVAVATTNATPATISTLPLTVSGDYLRVTADIVGKSGNNYYRGVKTVLMRNISGTLTAVGTVADITTPMSDAALATATFTITQSGTNVLVNVTGVLATNISWTGIVKYKLN